MQHGYRIVWALFMGAMALGCRGNSAPGDGEESNPTDTGSADTDSDTDTDTDTDADGDNPSSPGTPDVLDPGEENDTDVGDPGTPDSPIPGTGEDGDIVDYPDTGYDGDITYPDTAWETDVDGYPDYPDVDTGWDGEPDKPYPGEPITTDPDECELDYRSAGDDYCSIQMICDNQYVWLDCYAEGGDDLYCYCDTGYSYQNYQIGGVEPSDACGYVMDLCITGEQPETTSEPVCEPSYESASDDYCQIELECASEVAISDDVTAQVSDYQGAYCYNEGEDGWMCECDTGGGYLQLTVPSAEDSRALCTSTLEICQQAEAVASDAPITCDDASQSAGVDWCETELECVQQTVIDDGTDDGVVMEMMGWTWTSCNLDSDDGNVWACECGGGSEITSYEITGESAWDACTASAEQCAAAVSAEGVIGGSGGRYYEDEPIFI